MPNGLAKTSSPYLLMHAHQEVDWRPWGEEAWAEARRRGVPVFVSLGYASCHWCHVMSHESFDDAAIAKKMNESFVCIKVDREEHPDVDAVFMTTTQAMTGSGGWPNSVFCTPAGEPFFAGTYFPPEAMGGMPSFGEVLDALAAAWKERHEEVVESGAHIVAQLQEVSSVPAPATVVLRELRQHIADQFDPIHGGWGGAPKFPSAMLLDGLMVGGDPGELEMVTHTLEAMARGGICDQLGGGFHRYSVDAGWVVPHFEKMLYDNAMLLGTYARGWRRSPDHNAWLRSFFEHVVRRLVGWLEREMRTENGLFASALDADSSDAHARVHEGIYYVWNPELLHDALGPEDAEWAAQVFHVTNLGTFEHGLSTLLLHGHPDPERLARVQERMLAERATRFAPYRDDLVVAAWNGWLVDSLVQAAMVFGEPGWLAMARTTAQALWDVHVTIVDGSPVVARSSFEGTTTAPGTLEDHAALALGFARLAGALGEREWLDRSVALLEAAGARFGAGDGGWFDADANELLFTRPRDVADSVTPSGTSTMVAALHLAGLLAERDDLVAMAEAGAATQAGWLATHPRSAGWAFEQAMISDEARRGLKRATVVVAVPGDDVMAPLNRAAWRMAPAGSALVTLRDGQEWGTLGEGRSAQGNDGTAYTCRGTVCFEPASVVEDLRGPLWTRC